MTPSSGCRRTTHRLRQPDRPLSWLDDGKPQSLAVQPAKEYSYDIDVRPGFGE